jgi:hypothetical protein
MTWTVVCPGGEQNAALEAVPGTGVGVEPGGAVGVGVVVGLGRGVARGVVEGTAVAVPGWLGAA